MSLSSRNKSQKFADEHKYYAVGDLFLLYRFIQDRILYTKSVLNLYILPYLYFINFYIIRCNSQKSQSNPSYIEITTTDDIRINVMLPQPFDGDVSGFIEVRGTVKSKSTMACDSFICFSANMTKDFGE